MSSFFLVNDNARPEHPGDIAVFATLEAMLAYFEPWFAAEPHIVLDEAARTGRLVADGERLRLQQSGPRNPGLLVACIRQHLGAVDPQKVPFMAAHQPRLSRLADDDLLAVMHEYVDWSRQQTAPASSG